MDHGSVASLTGELDDLVDYVSAGVLPPVDGGATAGEVRTLDVTNGMIRTHEAGRD
jgi:hypothetical protein